MKIFTSFLQRAFLGLAAATMVAVAPATATQNLDPGSAVVPGFLAKPILASDHYTAQVGDFSIGVGQGGIQNLSNVTDADPKNAATTVNLAQLSLGADSWIKMVPDTEWFTDNGQTVPTYPEGTEVGFVMGSSTSAVQVLDLSVVSTMVVYFYKNGQHVGTSQMKYAGQTGLVDLDLINIDLEKKPQKMTAVAPAEFDSFGFGFTTVDLAVGSELAIYYAYIDDFVDVPIIKKYFANASSHCAGMVTGAKNLINNNLTDGATTAVLNIGGAYYDVYPGQEIPAGCEVGFVMTSGSALDLALGTAIRIRTYDADDNLQEETTSIGVVGLQVAGGGKERVSFLTSKPCSRIRLERIGVLELDLGATVVHYAYVHLPQMLPPDLPFGANMDIITKSEHHATVNAQQHQFTTLQNTSNNALKLYDDPELPLLVKGQAPASVWVHQTSAIGNGWLNNDCCFLGLYRQKTETDGTTGPMEFMGCIHLIHVTQLVVGTTKGHYYWQYASVKPNGSKDWHSGEYGELAVDGNKVSLKSINIPLDADDDPLTTSAIDAQYDYLLTTDESWDALKTLGENSKELASFTEGIPVAEIRREMAGSVEQVSADYPSPTMALDRAGSYVLVDFPEKADSNYDVTSVDFYSTALNSTAGTLLATYNVQSDGSLTCNSSQYFRAWKLQNGMYTVLADWYTGTMEDYYAVVHTNLNADYQQHVTDTYGQSTTGVATQMTREYGSHVEPINTLWSDLPTLTANTSGLVYTIPGTGAQAPAMGRQNAAAKPTYTLTYDVNLGAAEQEELESDKVLVNQWLVDGNDASVIANPTWNNQNCQTLAGNSLKGIANATWDHATHKLTVHALSTASHNAGDRVYATAHTRAYIPVRPASFLTSDQYTYIPVAANVEDGDEVASGDDNGNEHYEFTTDGTTTGIDSILTGSDPTDPATPAVYYDLQGRRVDAEGQSSQPGVYVRVAPDGRATKVLVR